MTTILAIKGKSGNTDYFVCSMKVWGLFKRGFNGAYRHWSVEHTRRHINEFAFRLNQGNCEVDTIDRIATVIKDSMGKILTYKELTQ